MPQLDEEEVRVSAIDMADQPRTRASALRSAVKETMLLPVFLVLTAMMVALWLMGMPFMQALTISTAVKISMVLFETHRRPCTSKS
ncbi:hypothetical protein GT030_07490 [Streptomyces sp. SID1328]|uniref:hypothetical protein n=1 Tax=Streptomyces sp. SID1328 TaxID=2690250 RepID=UPI00136FCD0E|nr:hypothetical protein [Streptomyces sp. SID1328]MYV38716.1 hypothetical protein [Streptomyces sp. SID1328]